MRKKKYWDVISDEYQQTTSISCSDFHYGPLLPGDRRLKLLPEEVAGLNCLEVACGAAQNSCYLAGRGAVCTAMDYAAEQLEHGRQLARDLGVSINFFQADIDSPGWVDCGRFDLIHSAYGLPFARDPAAVIRRLGTLLLPGGKLLISVGHPLYAGDWIELESGQEGIFLPDYFNLPADERTAALSEGISAAYYPVSTWTEWLHEAGFHLLRLLEPPPIDPSACSAADLSKKIPYCSPDWISLYPLLRRVPPVLILSAVRPA